MNGNLIQRLHSMSCPPQYFAFYVNKTTKVQKPFVKEFLINFWINKNGALEYEKTTWELLLLKV